MTSASLDLSFFANFLIMFLCFGCSRTRKLMGYSFMQTMLSQYGDISKWVIHTLLFWDLTRYRIGYIVIPEQDRELEDGAVSASPILTRSLCRQSGNSQRLFCSNDSCSFISHIPAEFVTWNHFRRALTHESRGNMGDKRKFISSLRKIRRGG